MALPQNIAMAADMTTGLPIELIAEGVKEYPKPEGIRFSYGTAGVRTR